LEIYKVKMKMKDETTTVIVYSENPDFEPIEFTIYKYNPSTSIGIIS